MIFNTLLHLFNQSLHLSLPIIRQVQNLGHPPKYGFSTGIWVILRLVSLSLYFLFCLQKCQLSLSIVVFVSLLNTIEQLFFPILIKVLNLLILFIRMCQDLHLLVIFLVQSGLFLLLMTALESLGYFSWNFFMKFSNCLQTFTV